MPKRAQAGLSSGVTVACGTSFGVRHQSQAQGQPRTKRIKLNKSAKELADKKREEQAQIATLSFQERQDLLVFHENDVDMSDPAWVDEDQVAFVQPPPGEEGFFSSHAGGEVQLQDLFLDTLAEHKRKDYRTRRDRIERQVQAWKSVLPHLVTAFLKFQHQGIGRGQV